MSNAAARTIALMFPVLAAPAVLLLVITAFVRGDMYLLRAAAVLGLASVGAGIGVAAFVRMLDMTSRTGGEGFVPWLLVVVAPVMLALELVSRYEPSWLRSSALQDALMSTDSVVLVLFATTAVAASLLAANVRRDGKEPAALHYRARLFTDRTIVAGVALVMLAAATVRVSRWQPFVGVLDPELPLLRREASRYPDHFATQHRYGEALLRYRQCSFAVEPLRNAVTLRPRDPVAANQLADALACDNQVPQAVLAYRVAIRLDPENIRGRYGLAYMLDLLHDSSAAEEYRSILLEWPNDAFALARQATIHFSRGDRSHALTEMRRALAVDTSSQVQHAGAELFANAQLYDEALPIYRSLAARDSADFATWSQYAAAAYHAGELKEAARAFDFLADRHPQLMDEVDEWRQMRDAAHRGILPSDFRPTHPPFKRAYDDTVLFHVR